MTDEHTHHYLVTRLDRMEMKLDGLQEAIVMLARVEERQHSQTDWNDRQEIDHMDIHERLDKLEQFKWKITGVLVVISLVVSVTVQHYCTHNTALVQHNQHRRLTYGCKRKRVGGPA